MSGGFDLGPEADDADGEQRGDEQVEQQVAETTQVEEEEEADPRENPQFSSEDVRQFPTYLRDEVLEEFQQTDTVEIQPFLASRDIKNVEKRELYDAVFRLAIENPERVGELIMEGRGLDPDGEN